MILTSLEKTRKTRLGDWRMGFVVPQNVAVTVNRAMAGSSGRIFQAGHLRFNTQNVALVSKF